jgi:fumarylacetoacetase
VNLTHDPRLQSWVDSAQGPTDFPIQNLPFGVFRRRDSQDSPRIGIAIGSDILDLSACRQVAWFSGPAEHAAEACTGRSLNHLMSMGSEYWSALRAQLSGFLATDSPVYRADRRVGRRVLVPMADAELLVPAEIGDYSDFYASLHHATNVGSMFRPDNPLLPNYKWVPIGYHGRASS